MAIILDYGSGEEEKGFGYADHEYENVLETENSLRNKKGPGLFGKVNWTRIWLYGKGGEILLLQEWRKDR